MYIPNGGWDIISGFWSRESERKPFRRYLNGYNERNNKE
jgi:hypothetical protein